MTSLSGQRRSFITRSDLSKPSRSLMSSSLIITGGLMVSPTPSLAKTKSPQLSPRLPLGHAYEIPPKNFVLRGTATSLKPLPMRKGSKLGSLSILVTAADPEVPLPTSSSVLCPDHLSKSSSLLTLPPLYMSSQSRSASPLSRLPQRRSASPLSSDTCSWLYSKRLAFQPRIDMVSRNLVILVFEGIVGDWLRPELWDKRPSVLHLRPLAIRGLQRLLTRFRVALFIQKPSVKSKRLLAHLQRFGVVFDAVYRSKNSWAARPYQSDLPAACLKYVQSYDQVYADFEVNEADKQAVVVSALRLCEEDMGDAKGTGFLFRQISDLRYETYVSGVPVSRDKESPVTLLFPDPLTREAQTGANFSELADCIIGLYDLLPRNEEETVNWQDLYWLLRTCKAKWRTEVVSTGFFQNEVLVHGLTVSAHSFPQRLKSVSCRCADKSVCEEAGLCPSRRRYRSLRVVGQDLSSFRNVFIVPELKGAYHYEVVDTETSLTVERKAEMRRPSKRLCPMDI